MTLDMDRREAEADAWEAGEHECQRTGHHFPRSTETNEPLRCTGCGLDPDLYEEDEVLDEATEHDPGVAVHIDGVRR